MLYLPRSLIMAKKPILRSEESPGVRRSCGLEKQHWAAWTNVREIQGQLPLVSIGPCVASALTVALAVAIPRSE
ncbi:hypothetical protein K449DRAFT_439883 [Hypoxylon sp. EC38]|nr:hypothetical protein K449DRAFT_439883 [Hypoxylon sp. EC38]